MVCREYDVFAPWTGLVPDVIKIANLLNDDYFSTEQLLDAVEGLRRTVA